jgi:ribose/xylose/arabinose/galactoside ABC-type transport system permease subunit
MSSAELTIERDGREYRPPRLAHRLRAVARREVSELSTWVLVVAITVAVVLGARTPRFFSVDNGKAILVSAGTIGIAALGVTLIMVCGGLVSLAVGETAAVAGMVFLFSLDAGLLPALVASMAVAAVVTALQGAMVGAWQANPIILTIAVASILTAVGASSARSRRSSRRPTRTSGSTGRRWVCRWWCSHCWGSRSSSSCS